MMRKASGTREIAAWLAGLIILLSWPHHSTAEQGDLLSVVRAAHRSARQSIHSFSATVTREVTDLVPKQQKWVYTGKYWRSLDVVRIQEGEEHTLLKGGEIRQVSRSEAGQRGQTQSGASRRAGVETLSLLDAWTLMMIDHPGPNGGRYDFDRFLEFAKNIPQVKRERKEGRDCLRLSLTIVATHGGEQEVTLWHDVNHNYLVWKKTLTYKGSPRLFESEILEFAEPQPGVFVPTKCLRRNTRAGELLSLDEITLAEVQVNRPISERALQLPAIPAGTILGDHIQGTRYAIDENWRPIGAASPIPKVHIVAKSEGEELDYHSQSSTEPTPLTRWILPISLVILVIACACLLYRQYRNQGRLQQPN